MKRAKAWRKRAVPGVIVLCLAVACCAGLAREAGLIQAGPMVGHVGEGSARIWVRVGTGAEIKAEARQGENRFTAAKIEDLGDGFVIAQFQGLVPATKTDAAISVGGAGRQTGWIGRIGCLLSGSSLQFAS